MTTLSRPTSQALRLPAALTNPSPPAVPEYLRGARAAVRAAAGDYLSIPDAALQKVWLYRGIDPEDGVRYGIYRAAETIESADAELEAALAGAPARPPGAIRSPTEAAGTIAEICARFDAVLDEWSVRVADLDADALAASARWSGVPVDVDFRLGRWSSHIREHTLQIDKTLDWLGYQPSEPVRIVRDLHATWGRLEARIFPIAPAGAEAAVEAILDRMSETLVREARDVRKAAEA